MKDAAAAVFSLESYMIAVLFGFMLGHGMRRG